MRRNKTTFVARLPRFSVRDISSVSLTVQRTGGQRPLPATMLDFSRLGMCLAIAEAFQSGETVVIGMAVAGEPPIHWQLPAMIRWVKPSEENIPSYGCEFVEPVAWEKLGELLLRGVLAQE